MDQTAAVLDPAASKLKTWAVRAVFVVLGLAAWWWTQALIGARPPAGSAQEMELSGEILTRGDAILMLTQPINAYLHRHRAAANALLIVSSAMIDALGLFLLVWSIFGRSLRPFLGLLVLFALRQITQALCVLPAPEGMIWPDGTIWKDPGFPSLLVTYSVANDFFFSGHTALAVYGSIELGRFGGRKLWLPAGLAALFLSAAVLVLRAHYTMDVFAGVIAAVLAAGVSRPLAAVCDRITRAAREA